MISKTLTSIDEYISDFSEDIQSLLNQVRSTIKQAAPEAEESIGYGMPAYKTYGKPLVYFAGFKNHIGFYALQPDMPNLQRSFQSTSRERVLSSFRSTSLCR